MDARTDPGHLHDRRLDGAAQTENTTEAGSRQRLASGTPPDHPASRRSTSTAFDIFSQLVDAAPATFSRIIVRGPVDDLFR